MCRYPPCRSETYSSATSAISAWTQSANALPSLSLSAVTVTRKSNARVPRGSEIAPGGKRASDWLSLTERAKKQVPSEQILRRSKRLYSVEGTHNRPSEPSPGASSNIPARTDVLRLVISTRSLWNRGHASGGVWCELHCMRGRVSINS